ncbi:hypothetical protein Lpp70_03241, partial [Lacticaseibacillus paracasei subsp. paracasei Lpp70]
GGDVPRCRDIHDDKGNFDIMVWYSKDGQCRIVLGHLLITSLAFGFDANKHSMDTE